MNKHWLNHSDKNNGTGYHKEHDHHYGNHAHARLNVTTRKQGSWHNVTRHTRGWTNITHTNASKEAAAAAAAAKSNASKSNASHGNASGSNQSKASGSNQSAAPVKKTYPWNWTNHTTIIRHEWA
jgi:hypothetical protein